MTERPKIKDPELVADFLGFIAASLFLIAAGYIVVTAKDHHDQPEEQRMCVSESGHKDVPCPEGRE